VLGDPRGDGFEKFAVGAGSVYFQQHRVIVDSGTSLIINGISLLDQRL
jgi:hypothetical protein